MRKCVQGVIALLVALVSYTINETEHTVTHHVLSSLRPWMVGMDLKRAFEFSVAID